MRHITSVQHPIVKHLVKLRQNRDYRYDQQSVLIEGITLVTEMRSHKQYKRIVVLDELLIPLGVQAEDILIVNDSVMKKISGVQTPEGIIAEIAMPQPVPLEGKRYIIVFDGLNDPGNMGTLLRSALALGWEGAFILEGSCDPFNDKALRASRGATFRLPLAWGSWDDLKRLIEVNRLTPFVADLGGRDLADVAAADNILLILGNEARGASETARQVGQALTIAMPGDMESLNVGVAGSIMMYALRPNERV